MHLDPRPQLLDPGADLQDLQTDRVEPSPRPRRPLKVTPPQRMQKHIGHGMEEEPELIGLEPVAGGPVGEKISLMVLDHRGGTGIPGWSPRTGGSPPRRCVRP